MLTGHHMLGQMVSAAMSWAGDISLAQHLDGASALSSQLTWLCQSPSCASPVAGIQYIHSMQEITPRAFPS